MIYSVGSLFSGIGGIDLGIEETSRFKTEWFCEKDDYCKRVLKAHWPGVPVYGDVAEVDESTPYVDVITAGFPCQPVSQAGKRLAQKDERWLWPHVERSLGLLRPRGFILENVPGLFTAGFGDVLGGIHSCGYDAEWDCIPASAIGAPHRRDRVFIIGTRRELADPEGVLRGWPSPMADADGTPRSTAGGTGQAVLGPRQIERLGRRGSLLKDSGWPSPMAYASGEGLEGSWSKGTTPDGVSQGRVWATEPDVGRVANGVPSRVDRLRALGNAVVPQVAKYVGEVLARRLDEKWTRT